jgi:hypothetical protein
MLEPKGCHVLQEEVAEWSVIHGNASSLGQVHLGVLVYAIDEWKYPTRNGEIVSYSEDRQVEHSLTKLDPHIGSSCDVKQVL